MGMEKGDHVLERANFIHDASPYFNFNIRTSTNLATQSPERFEDTAHAMHETDLRNWGEGGDWRDDCDPWRTIRENLSAEQYAELGRYQRQNWQRLEREEREKNFEEKIRLQREAFKEEEEERWLDTMYSFGYRLWVRLSVHYSLARVFHWEGRQ